MNPLILCSEEPSFFGLGGDNKRELIDILREKYPDESIGNGFRIKGKIKQNISRCYFHGKLEEILGFDLVNRVAGNLPEIVHLENIPCTAVDNNLEHHECVIVPCFTIYESWHVITEEDKKSSFYTQGCTAIGYKFCHEHFEDPHIDYIEEQYYGLVVLNNQDEIAGAYDYFIHNMLTEKTFYQKPKDFLIR